MAKERKEEESRRKEEEAQRGNKFFGLNLSGLDSEGNGEGQGPLGTGGGAWASMSKTITETSSSSSDESSIIKTSSNWYDSDDEENPLNKAAREAEERKAKAARQVQFPDSDSEDEEKGAGSGEPGGPALRRGTGLGESASKKPGRKVQSKVANFREDIAELKKKKNVEQVWIDFGKQHTKIKHYDPADDENGNDGELNFLDPQHEGEKCSHGPEVPECPGHQIYFVMPPDLELIPSNVMIFELIYLSSKSSSDDVVMGWGAFPLVNGDFQCNQGKFLVPLINGDIDYTIDSFKTIEGKYRRNIDEWLGNLYVDIKKVELNDFREYESRICLTTKKMARKRTLTEKAKRLLSGFGKKGKTGDGSDSSESMNSDDMDSDDSDNKELEFTDLRTINYHEYKYCSAATEGTTAWSDEDAAALAYRKVEFLLNEILADMGITKSSPLKWVTNLFLATLMLWMRMLLHNVGQYILLKSLDCPVTEVSISWYQVKVVYGFWNVAQEIGVVVVGPLTNTALFWFMTRVINVSQNQILCFPRILSKAFVWFGFFTIFDFFLIAIIDFATQDDTGDLFKLYNYFEKASAAGFIGYFMTFILQFLILLVNIILFYNHILFIHHDAKIADIYLRISGKGRDYFVPYDNELSFRLLEHQYVEGELNNNRIIANKLDIWDSTRKEEFNGKILHFHKFVSAKSLEPGKAYWGNIFGQIRDI